MIDHLPHYKNIGDKLKLYRKLSKKTLRQVQIATGVNNGYLSQLENGKIDNPSYRTVFILLQYYNPHIPSYDNL